LTGKAKKNTAFTGFNLFRGSKENKEVPRDKQTGTKKKKSSNLMKVAKRQ